VSEPWSGEAWPPSSDGPDVKTLRTALDWLSGRDTGLSSMAILMWMMGGPVRRFDYPRDADDLGRCLRLLDRIPAWRSRIGEMAACGPEWAALVKEWPALERMMGNADGRAAVYYFMRKMIENAQKVAA
jgi:hypothetical protein